MCLNEEARTFVPYGDMINTSFEPNVVYKYDAQEHAFIFKTIRPIEIGEEIYNNYGQAEMSASHYVT